MATNSTHSAPTRVLFKTLAYDPVKDFTPVARAGSYVFMLVVHPASRPDAARARRLRQGQPRQAHLCERQHHRIVAGETLKHRAGIDVLHVPYKSTPRGAQRRDRRPGLDDVHRSRTGARARARGTLRALAVTRASAALLPRPASLNEAGIAGYNVTSWAGLFAPAGTPKEIVARINDEMRKIIAIRRCGRASRSPGSTPSPVRRKRWPNSCRPSSRTGAS